MSSGADSDDTDLDPFYFGDEDSTVGLLSVIDRAANPVDDRLKPKLRDLGRL